MRLAYNTNGVSNHRLDDALELIAESGYDGVALTLDHHHFDPLSPDLETRAHRLDRQLRDLGLGLVIETGARFLLDPRRKHEPTLVSADPHGRSRRLEFLRRAIDVAAVCEAEAVSFWAGVRAPDTDPDEAWAWLVDGVHGIAEYAKSAGVRAALEPEPGMLIETVDDYRALRSDAGLSSAELPLALDVGHCLVTGDREPGDAVRETEEELATLSIEDMRRGVHEHLPFGEGDVNLRDVVDAIHAIDWRGLTCVELSRDAHRADRMVPSSIQWLQVHTDSRLGETRAKRR